MKTDFEQECLDLMLATVRRKRQRKQLLRGASVALVFITGLSIVLLQQKQQAIDSVIPSTADQPLTAPKAYQVVHTQPGLYSRPSENPSGYVLRNTDNQPKYKIINHYQLFAVMPDSAIHIELDGAETFIMGTEHIDSLVIPEDRVVN